MLSPAFSSTTTKKSSRILRLRIYFTAYIDMLQQGTSWNLPAGLVIDIKTSSTVLPEPHSILRLDPQLREYALVTGIEDVAFL